MKRWLCALLSVIVLLAAVPMATLSAATVTYGDVNDDGKINNKDLGLLQQHLNEWDVDADTTAADTNGDGLIRIDDVTEIQKYVAELIHELGPKQTSS